MEEIMKHIVITGSTRGIGLGLTKRFLEQGCIMTINGTSDEHVQNTLNNLRELYPNSKVNGLSGSTTDYHKMELLWDYAANTFGNVDIWINNAGIDQERKQFWLVHPNNYQNVIETNIVGVMNGSQIAFKKMLEQGYGQIFNMEGFGSDGMKQNKMTIYGTSKRAVRYFTNSLAKEAKKTKVQVSTLSPGMVLTDFLLKSLEDKNNEEIIKTKKVFNILADHVDDVTAYLSKKILENTKNNAHIAWLTSRKIILRFLTAKIKRRNIMDKKNSE